MPCTSCVCPCIREVSDLLTYIFDKCNVGNMRGIYCQIMTSTPSMHTINKWIHCQVSQHIYAMHAQVAILISSTHVIQMKTIGHGCTLFCLRNRDKGNKNSHLYVSVQLYLYLDHIFESVTAGATQPLMHPVLRVLTSAFYL